MSNEPVAGLPPGDKATAVRTMFDRIARRYDLTNDVMTLGNHRLWKRAVIGGLLAEPGTTYLDIATGTGDLALALANRRPTARVIGLDFSGEMLALANRRSRRPPGRSARQQERGGLTFVRADALALPFADGTFAGAMSSFALRNVADLGQLFRETHRVLAAGGSVALLDLVPVPSPPPLTRLAQLHLRRVVPLLGRALAGDAAAYTYLPSSIGTIPSLPEIERLLREVGFVQVRHRLFGLGTVALITGLRGGRLPASTTD